MRALSAEGLGVGVNVATFTSAGNLQLVSGSTITSNGTLSISTAASAAQTGTPALIINQSGNVGVGTTSPATKIHMSSGTLTIDGNAATSLTTTGSVGIGTASPSATAKLHVAGDIIGNAQVFRAYMTADFAKAATWDKAPAGARGPIGMPSAFIRTAVSRDSRAAIMPLLILLCQAYRP